MSASPYWRADYIPDDIVVGMRVGEDERGERPAAPPEIWQDGATAGVAAAPHPAGIHQPPQDRLRIGPRP